LSNDLAKWLTIVSPLLATLGPVIVVRLCEWHRNFITVCAVAFTLSLVLMLLITLFFEQNVILSLVLLSLYLVVVNGGRSVSLSIAALRMRERIDAGVYTTLINAAASIVAGVAPKLITSILDREELSVSESWQSAFFTVLIWNAVIVVALFSLRFAVKLLNRRDEKRAAARAAELSL
jgi:hypothetical protein